MLDVQKRAREDRKPEGRNVTYTGLPNRPQVNRNKIKDLWFPCLAAKTRLFELQFMDSDGALVFFLVVCSPGEQSKQNISLLCFPGHPPTVWLAVALLPMCLLSRAQAPFFFQAAVRLCWTLLLFHCASLAETARPRACPAGKLGSPRAPNLLCPLLILGMKSFNVRGGGSQVTFIWWSRWQTESVSVAAQCSCGFLATSKTTSELSFINCVVHGICRLGFNFRLLLFKDCSFYGRSFDKVESLCIPTLYKYTGNILYM